MKFLDLRIKEGGETIFTLSDPPFDTTGETVHLYLRGFNETTVVSAGTTSGAAAGTELKIAAEFDVDPGSYFYEVRPGAATAQKDLLFPTDDREPYVVVFPRNTDE